ncbi:MAG: hypothetical protein A3B38_03155 [Candidatus Levybacteria bacterium RIFCSPLOWO2_01_FULL_36_13]|nr:MAG: hypothetical protein A3B38_03155 [Candidatus Levybacteria bacterium RIFCSPLOWO2_01_FULL_36_13]
MLKLLPKVLLLLFILYAVFSFNSYAQYRTPKGNLGSTVSGTLGDFYLTVSGYIAPFASIVLTSDGVYLRATTADENGYFTIPEVLIKKGFSKFCFDAIDFRRLGESFSCKTIPPATGSVTIEDIFLPPTLGLSRSTIEAGGSTTAWGYTMPNATVILNFAGKNLTIKADSTGFYQFVLNNVQAGIYELSAKAKLNDKKSLDPQKKVTLKSLSKADQVVNWLEELLRKLWDLLTTYWFIWIVVPVLILIIILLGRLLKLHRHHYLHHKYFVGY